MSRTSSRDEKKKNTILRLYIADSFEVFINNRLAYSKSKYGGYPREEEVCNARFFTHILCNLHPISDLIKSLFRKMKFGCCITVYKTLLL